MVFAKKVYVSAMKDEAEMTVALRIAKKNVLKGNVFNFGLFLNVIAEQKEVEIIAKLYSV